MDITEDRIETNNELTEEERSICDANYTEIILHYIVNPVEFFTHFYNSILSMSWKFYCK